MPARARPVPPPHWLNRDSLRIYPWPLLLTWIGIAIWWFSRFSDGRGPGGEPLGADFIAFWAAGQLALAGDASAAWDSARLFAAQQLAIADSSGNYAWFYPPTALLLVTPLALLPYAAAWLLFMAGSFVLWLRTLWQELPERGGWPLLLAFPAVLANLQYGQNGLLTCAIACLALTRLEQRPLLAGTLLSLLTLKPQLLMPLTLLLFASRAWPALLGLAGGSLALALTSLLLWGSEPWLAWPHALDLASRLTREGALPWLQMPSLFAGLRLWRLPVELALTLHALLALGALLLAGHIWRQTRDHAVRGSAAVIATLLCSPYLFDYDLAWLALPLIWLTRLGLRHGWQRGEREVLALTWLQPFFGPLLMQGLHLPSAPPLLLALLLMTWRHARLAGMRGTPCAN